MRAEAGNSNISISGNDDNDTAYGVRAGYFFNANFGVEGFYSNYGEDSGGGVSAEGRPGAGATFRFTLPAREAAP